MTGRSHTGQEIPAGNAAARAFDPCSVAGAPELRPLKRLATFAAHHQNRLPGRVVVLAFQQIVDDTFDAVFDRRNSPRGWWRYGSLHRSRRDITLHDEHLGFPATVLHRRQVELTE